MRKRLSLILVLSMVVFVLSGCIFDEEATVTDTNTETTEETTVETTEEETEDDKETEESVDKEEDNQDKETTASEKKENTEEEKAETEEATEEKVETKPATSEKKEEAQATTQTTTQPASSDTTLETPVENTTPAPETPAVHEHNWVAETIHHDAETHQETVTKTIHHDAVTETVYYMLCECGAEFYNSEDLCNHQYSTGCGSSCGMTKQVEVSPAWDEVVTETVTITDKAAWDEVIYRCSCGATK